MSCLTVKNADSTENINCLPDSPSAWLCQWMTLQCVMVRGRHYHLSETSPRFPCRRTSPGCWGWTNTKWSSLNFDLNSESSFGIVVIDKPWWAKNTWVVWAWRGWKILFVCSWGKPRQPTLRWSGWWWLPGEQPQLKKSRKYLVVCVLNSCSKMLIINNI